MSLTRAPNDILDVYIEVIIDHEKIPKEFVKFGLYSKIL